MPIIHRRFLLLLALFVVGTLAQGWALPVAEGSDESIHYTYVELVRLEHRLPDRTNVRQNSTRQASGQAPLTYVAAALVADALNLPRVGSQDALDHLYTVRNHWITPPNAWNRTDNLNHYLHGRDESAFNQPDIVMSIRALRLTSLLYGVLAVVGAYGAAREVLSDESWALTATALFAFMPTLMHLASYLNNDISLIAFCTLALWRSLRLLRVGASPRRLLLIGLLLALGALSKVSALLIAPAVGVAVLLDWWARRRSVVTLIVNGALVGLPVLALFAPWVAWGWLTYGDPFGTLTHRNPTLSYTTLLSAGEVLRLMPEVYLSYWGKFGLAKVYLHPVTYTVMGMLAALAVVGYGIRIWRVKALTLNPSPSGRGTLLSFSLRGKGWGDEGRILTRYQTLVLLTAALVVFAGLIRWMQEIAVITGRLMYPAHIAIVIGLTGGLYLLSQPLSPQPPFPASGERGSKTPLRLWGGVGEGVKRGIQCFTLGLLAVSGVIISPVIIHAAYAPPPLLTRDQLPPLQGAPVDYDGTIRLLGYAQDSPYLSDALHPITLCWEVLKPAERPAAFSLKLVRDGIIVADRTSYHGLGRYPASEWRAGDIFCDTVELPMDDPDVQDDPLPQPATVYDILVVLLDPATRDVNWQAATSDGTPIEFPVIGQVIRPADRAENTGNAVIRFPGFADLAEVVVSDAGGKAVQPGDTLSLALRWHVTGRTPDTWTMFTHLVGNGVSMSLADGQPRGGAYPTWAWSPGESILDEWQFTLPDDLLPGEYYIQLGFYRQDTGERMPVTLRGGSVANSAVTVYTLSIEE